MEIITIREIVEVKPWLFKVRSKNKRKYYDVVIRKDGTYFCSDPSYKYISDECNHILMLKAFLE